MFIVLINFYLFSYLRYSYMGSVMDVTRRIFTKAIVRLIPLSKTSNLSTFNKEHKYFFSLYFIVKLIKGKYRTHQ